jgi:hypothetical protein
MLREKKMEKRTGRKTRKRSLLREKVSSWCETGVRKAVRKVSGLVRLMLVFARSGDSGVLSMGAAALPVATQEE